MCCGQERHYHHTLDLVTGDVESFEGIEESELQPTCANNQWMPDHIAIRYRDRVTGSERTAYWLHEGNNYIEHVDRDTGALLVAVGRDELDGQAYVPCVLWLFEGGSQVVPVDWMDDGREAGVVEPEGARNG